MDLHRDLLALRFPSPAAVHCVLVDSSGTRGTAFDAQGVDVSRSGVRLEARDLPADLLKRLGNLDEECHVEVAFSTRGGNLPVVGIVRWMKNFPGGRWLIGIEYLEVDLGRGTAISRHFERRYNAPQIYRSAAIAAGIVAILAGALVLEGKARQSRHETDARGRLDQAIGEKEAITALLLELESSVDKIGTSGESRDELVVQIAALRGELDKAREEVGKRSVRLAEVAKPESGKTAARDHALRGDGFFNQGNLSAALVEYEKAIELESRLPEAWLKAGIIHEFQERPVRALEAYGRYLELRKDAPDWHEVNSRVEHLAREVGPAL